MVIVIFVDKLDLKYHMKDSYVSETEMWKRESNKEVEKSYVPVHIWVVGKHDINPINICVIYPYTSIQQALQV